MQSLANAVVGITHVAVLAIHAIGQVYAQVAGITPKSGVKQIDRLLSNSNLALNRVLETWVKFVIVLGHSPWAGHATGLQNALQVQAQG